MAEVMGPNIYVSYNISLYNTPSTWGFILAPVQGETIEVALESANTILNTMSAPGVPEPLGDIMICNYDTGRDDVIAAAIKDNSQISPMKLKQYFLKAH